MNEPNAETFYLFGSTPADYFPLAPDALVVWLDDTGQKRFGNTPFFGFGGAAILGAAYGSVLHHPWRQMKAEHFGGADVSLHAAELSPTMRQEEALRGFFQSAPFDRLAALVTTGTVIDPDLDSFDILAFDLLMDVYRIAFPGGRQAARSLVLIFEDSKEHRDMVNTTLSWAVEKAANEFASRSALSATRWPLPVKWGFLPKAAASTPERPEAVRPVPGLEVADFVINSAGRHARMPGATWRDRLGTVIFDDAGGLAHFKTLKEFVSR